MTSLNRGKFIKGGQRRGPWSRELRKVSGSGVPGVVQGTARGGEWGDSASFFGGQRKQAWLEQSGLEKVLGGEARDMGMSHPAGRRRKVRTENGCWSHSEARGDLTALVHGVMREEEPQMASVDSSLGEFG